MGIFDSIFGKKEPLKNNEQIVNAGSVNLTSYGSISSKKDEEILVFPTSINGNFVMLGIEVKTRDLDKIYLPCYCVGKPIDSILKNEFVQDVDGLLPKKLTNQWKQECLNELQRTVIRHYNRFNRITPYDLETYITEAILVISSIGQQIGEPISSTEQAELFKRLLQNISKQFEIPVELSF